MHLTTSFLPCLFIYLKKILPKFTKDFKNIPLPALYMYLPPFSLISRIALASLAFIYNAVNFTSLSMAVNAICNTRDVRSESHIKRVVL